MFVEKSRNCEIAANLWAWNPSGALFWSLDANWDNLCEVARSARYDSPTAFMQDVLDVRFVALVLLVCPLVIVMVADMADIFDVVADRLPALWRGVVADEVKEGVLHDSRHLFVAGEPVVAGERGDEVAPVHPAAFLNAAPALEPSAIENWQHTEKWLSTSLK